MDDSTKLIILKIKSENLLDILRGFLILNINFKIIHII